VSPRRRVARAVTRLRHRAGAATGLDRRADRRIFFAALPVGSERAVHLLVAPPGGGNIGDQAMVEAFLENTVGQVVVITRHDDDINLPDAQRHRVVVEALPGLVYGDGAEHRASVRRFAALVATAASVSVVGADIMDGAYNPRASTRRADLAGFAREAGVDARILGFSWNGRADAGALRALRRADRAGTELLLRDPVSARRAGEDSLRNVVPVADMVFAARSIDMGESERLLGSEPGPYAVVNASGLVARAIDQVPEYATVVRSLLGEGMRVVLLPHVVRHSADDAAACAAVAERVADDRVMLVDRVLAPAEVRGLCKGARLVVTGRMHLAIQAMWSHVPAVTLSTQGKVEGLMRLFDTDDLCLEPGAGLAERMLPLLRSIEADRDSYVARLRDRMPGVRELAARNFSTLPTVAGADRPALRPITP